MPRNKKAVWLAMANMIALPVLASPAFGFIAYMNRRGIAEFVLFGWLSTVVLVVLLWPKVPGSSGPKGYLLSLASAFIPVALAWAFAMRGLYVPEDEVWRDLWTWARDAVVLGGFFTAAFWVPASIVNWRLLRRAT